MFDLKVTMVYEVELELFEEEDEEKEEENVDGLDGEEERNGGRETVAVKGESR